MNKEELLKLNDQVIDAWNTHNSEKFTSLFDENGVWRINRGKEVYRGKSELKEYFNRWKTAFPDINLKIRTKTVTEDSIVVEYELTGTQNGVLHIREDLPEISPTHKTVSVGGCYITKIKNGKVLETNVYPDRLALFEQLGVMSELMHHA